VPRLLSLQRLRSWLGAPRAPLGVVVIAVLIALPSLGNGLASDDHWHKINLTRDPAWSSIAKPWYRLFTFFDGDPARTHRVVDYGIAPWWSDLDIVASFFRPVTAATHLLDYTLWPSHPWLMHAHSIAWYAALVAAAAWTYRRLLARPADQSSTWVAGLAALLYAFDHTHGIPVGWVANRNALVAGFFALASLVAHDVATRGPAHDAASSADAGEGARPRLAWSFGSAILFLLGLGSGEGALAVAGYFVAHAVFLDARAWRERIASFVPHGVAFVVWFVAYRGGGFGVRGSGMYVEPLREPVAFGTALLKHAPMLVASELGAPTPDLYTFLPLAAKVGFVVGALLFLAWSATAVIRVWRIDPVARFFLAGGVLATLPACATFPSGRLLVVPGFGLIGFVAIVAAGVVDGASWVPALGWRRRLARSFGIWALVGHLFVAPLALQIGMQQLVVLNHIIARLGADLPSAPTPTLKRVVFMNAPDTVFAPYFLLGRSAGGDAAPARLPARLLCIAGGARTVDLRRTDEHTVVAHVSGGFYRTGTELVTRSESVPMPVGTTLVLSDVTVEVLETARDGVPTLVAFRFDESADADAYLWQRWQGSRLVTVAPPAVGEHVTIAGQIAELW
jgi:hypothetical protein